VTVASRSVAAIDVGTNSVLMWIARCDASGAIETLVDLAEITGLGRGVDRTRVLDDRAIERTLATLGEYAERARAHDAAIRAVGTSALRDARNAASLLARARDLGVDIEVVSGEREAELTFRGAAHGIDLGSGALTVVDIGGGSTEIVSGASGRVDRAVSLELGSVRLFERHLRSDPPSDDEIASLVREVDAVLATAPLGERVPLVAIAGTATTIGAIARGIDPYDGARAHGLRLDVLELLTIARDLAAKPLAERKRIAGLEPARADVIVAGALLLSRIAARAAAQTIVLSNGGVRVGLALDLLRAAEGAEG